MQNKNVVENTKNKLRVIRKTIAVANKKLIVQRRSVGYIENKYGEFYLNAMKVSDRWKDYLVLLKAKRYEGYFPIFGNNDFYLRLDSGCISGDIFLDDTCDCRPLLENAMKTIAKKGNGMVIMSLGQDGRGFGTEFKLNTLTLIKEAGIGTVEAFRELSGKKSVDKRSYDGFIAILKFFNVGKNITLMTNNPEKAKILESAGFNTRVLEDGHPKGNKILERNVKSKLKYGVVSS